MKRSICLKQVSYVGTDLICESCYIEVEGLLLVADIITISIVGTNRVTL